jgi:hypothetical protein
MDAQSNLKRLAFPIMGGVLAVLLVSWLWHYYHTGKIIITTSNSYNTITLTKTNSGNGQSTAPSFKAHSRLSVNIGTGKYVASVTGNSIATSQTINLKPRATLRYTINPINATGVEPVAYENAQAITATAHELVYIDASSNTLSKVDDQNGLAENYGGRRFKTVKWAGSSFGVGQGDDGHLYTIAGKSVSPLEMPFYYGSKALDFDVSPNKNIYVSYGADVYAGSQKGGFHKIYTASSFRPALAAGVNQVAVADSKYGKNASDISKPLLATINASGKKNKENVEAERLAWSPNGQYLAGVNEVNPTIYDATLHTMAVVPAKSVVGQIAWLNNTTLLYTVNDQLWTYNLPQQKAQLLANMPLSNSITGLYLSDDGSYIYVTSFDPNTSSYAIKRIGLKGQKVPDYIYNLQDILPISSGSYTLGLINFSGTPRILVRVAPSINPDSSLPQAMQQLQGLGFDTSKLRFDIEQIKS